MFMWVPFWRRTRLRLFEGETNCIARDPHFKTLGKWFPKWEPSALKPYLELDEHPDQPQTKLTS